MPTDDPMTIDERHKYLRIMQFRYRQASRPDRGRLLDEMEKVNGLHRKSFIRLMARDLARRSQRKQRGPIYGRQVDTALRILAESLDYVCAERLQPNLVWLAQHLAQHGELELTPELLEQLGHISVSTVRRRLQHLAQDQPRLPRRRPQPANRSLRDIPHPAHPLGSAPARPLRSRLRSPLWPLGFRPVPPHSADDRRGNWLE